MNATVIAKAIGHAIFKHDLNITDDLFIIHANELDTLCEDATREITENQSLTIDHTTEPTDMKIYDAAVAAHAEYIWSARKAGRADDGSDLTIHDWVPIVKSVLNAARKAVAE